MAHTIAALLQTTLEPATLAAIRYRWGLSRKGMARTLGLAATDGTTIRKWETGALRPSGPARLAYALLNARLLEPAHIDRLESTWASSIDAEDARRLEWTLANLCRAVADYSRATGDASIIESCAFNTFQRLAGELCHAWQVRSWRAIQRDANSERARIMRIVKDRIRETHFSA